MRRLSAKEGKPDALCIPLHKAEEGSVLCHVGALSIQGAQCTEGLGGGAGSRATQHSQMCPWGDCFVKSATSSVLQEIAWFSDVDYLLYF